MRRVTEVFPYSDDPRYVGLARVVLENPNGEAQGFRDGPCPV